MSTSERLIKLATATPAVLAKVDAVLNGNAADVKPDRDLRTVTYTDAARRLGLSRPTVYRLVLAGRLKTVELNGVKRITVESLEAFIDGKEAS